MTPDNIAQARCRTNEGLALIRYRDATGWAIGYGHHVRRRGDCPDTCTQAQAEKWFKADWEVARHGAARLCARHRLVLKTHRAGVLDEMVFQMGRSKVAKFKRFFRHSAAGEWHDAALEMLHRGPPADMRPTLWRSKTPGRCERLADVYSTGNAG